jgi:hypothetical protein
MGQTRSIEVIVATILTEMGIPADSLVPTILLKNRCFVGHKFRFDGGYAIWWAENNVAAVYDEGGKVLKTVVCESDEKEAA